MSPTLPYSDVEVGRSEILPGEPAVLMNLVGDSFLQGQQAGHIPELAYHRVSELSVEGGKQDQSNLIAAWSSLNIRVIQEEFNREHGDHCFVQDPALVLEDLVGGGYAALELNPGDEYRRQEVPELIRGLAPFVRRIVPWEGHGFIEGGDIMPPIRTGPNRAMLPVFLRLPTDEDELNSCSRRTAFDGINSLAELVAPLGYDVCKFEFSKTLHATSRMSLAGRDTDGRVCLVADPRFLPNDQQSKLAEHGIRLVVIPEELFCHSWFAVNIPCLDGKRIVSSIPEVREFFEGEGLPADAVVDPMVHMAGLRGSGTCLCQLFGSII